MSARKEVIIHTDGSCLGNPGAGGWAAILEYQTKSGEVKTLELSGGDANTTNNRMELQAAIGALEVLREPCAVTLYTDSQYLRKAFEDGWLRNWQRNGWMTKDKQPVKNKELWEKLINLEQFHKVSWAWLKGHAGHDLNERCDVLARAEAKKILTSSR
jgi:ribonuclease HI